MKTRHGMVELFCPVTDSEGDPCEKPIFVQASPYIPSRGYDPPEGGVIEDVDAPQCEHEKVLNSGQWDEALWDQLEDVGGAY